MSHDVVIEIWFALAADCISKYAQALVSHLEEQRPKNQTTLPLVGDTLLLFSNGALGLDSQTLADFLFDFRIFCHDPSILLAT